LENLTDRDLKFKTFPELHLSFLNYGNYWSPHAGDYWAPTDIVANKPLETRSVDIGGIQPVPIKIRLTKNSATVFQVDAANTHWAQTISSIWPSVSLRAITPGSYLLRLEFEIGGSLVRSNGIKIVIGKENQN
jgi:hypothetical protein